VNIGGASPQVASAALHGRTPSRARVLAPGAAQPPHLMIQVITQDLKRLAAS